MSHVESIKLNITDLDALEAACKSIGLELSRGQKTYRWWGHSVGDYPIPAGFTANDLGKCEHAIRIPNNNSAYEIGVVKNRDGRDGYTLLWDFYAGGKGMQSMVGDSQASKLVQANQLEVASRNIPRDYRIVDQQVDQTDGALVITIDGSIMAADSSDYDS
jgi:hypothetical protein